MVSGKHKSGRLRKVSVKTPGGNTKVHYKQKKPNSAKCANCGAVLKGVARELPSKMKNLPISQKRPTRQYGGNLCSKCTRSLIKEKTRTSLK